jgi:glucokinase
MNLKDEFRNRLQLGSDFPIVFENDGWAFTRGEAWQGAAKGFHRVIGLTLGTGLGSGFYIDDDIVDSGPGVPPTGWFSGLPYKDGMIDDYISKRAIMAYYQKLKKDKQETSTVKDIAERGKMGEVEAQKVFHDMGSLLGNLLTSTVQEFKPECIVIGGKIALSFDLFAPNVTKELQPFTCLKKITKALHIEIGGILGAGRLLFKKIVCF